MNTAFKIFIAAIYLILSTAFLSGCSSEDERPQDMSEKALYEAAQDNLKNDSFNLAVKNLQLLEARYPFGPYAEQAQLEIIYAHYRNFEPEAAVESANLFIPSSLHPNVDYASISKAWLTMPPVKAFSTVLYLPI